jgi:hypothetical protein
MKALFGSRDGIRAVLSYSDGDSPRPNRPKSVLRQLSQRKLVSFLLQGCTTTE